MGGMRIFITLIGYSELARQMVNMGFLQPLLKFVYNQYLHFTSYILLSSKLLTSDIVVETGESSILGN